MSEFYLSSRHLFATQHFDFGPSFPKHCDLRIDWPSFCPRPPARACPPSLMRLPLADARRPLLLPRPHRPLRGPEGKFSAPVCQRTRSPASRSPCSLATDCRHDSLLYLCGKGSSCRTVPAELKNPFLEFRHCACRFRLPRQFLCSRLLRAPRHTHKHKGLPGPAAPSLKHLLLHTPGSPTPPTPRTSRSS